MIHSDTIAAVSTGMTSAGISMIRISGEQAFVIADQIFRGPGKAVAEMPSHTIHYGFIYDGDRMVDEVLLSVMRAPATYTREDIVEINCHGGIAVTKEVLRVVLERGARLAEPGEFTKRAFLNGRIDLSQAEAVMDLIQSGSRAAMDASLRQLRGSLKERILTDKDAILQTIAMIEAALDDPEHYDTGMEFRGEIQNSVSAVYTDLKKLADTFENGRVIREGIRAVIVGKPNAGKSSIMNVLLGENRAIVTDIAGTTRDTLEESLKMDGLMLNIIDTAGIRETEDAIEQIGMERALSAVEEADLVIYVIDGSVPLDQNDHVIMDRIRGKKTICLINKADLPAAVDEDNIHHLLSSPVLRVSAKEHQGMEAFSEEVKKMFEAGKLQAGEETFLTNLRHYEEICSAVSSLTLAMDSMKKGMPEDFISIDLTDAYHALANVVGEDVGDDLIDRIFSTFCVGK